MSDLIGQQWGNYRLTRLLSHGTMAAMYVGEHARFKTSALVEVFHAQLIGNGEAIFQREAQAQVQLFHAHILRLLDFDIQNGRPFFVLDNAPNGSLQQRHAYGTRVSLEQVSNYAGQVASALQYAHGRGLVHGAVQPEYMLLNEQDEVVLSDFGLLAIAHALASTNGLAPMGALAYMAPEQIQGRAVPASDQYALAVTVHQWLCGVWPFQGSPAELVARHLSLQPPPLSQYVPELAGAVEQVVLRALEKDPARRFPGVLDFAQALESARRGAGVLTATSLAASTATQMAAPMLLATPSPLQAGAAAPAQAVPTQSPFVGQVSPAVAPAVLPPRVPGAAPGSKMSRRTALIAGGVVVAGLAVVGLGTVIVKGLGGQRANNTITGTPVGALVHVYQGQQDVSSDDSSAVAVFWSPDSKRILSIGGKDPTLQCWDALTGAYLTTYKPLEKSVSTAYLVDGISWTQQDPLYLWLDNPIAHLIDVATGQELYTTHAADPGEGGNWSLGVYWSPDGSRFASIENNFNVPSAVRVHKASDGSSISSFHPKYTGGPDSDDWIKESARYILWSPDNSRILSWGENTILYIWNASNGSLLFSTQKYAQATNAFSRGDLAWSPDGKYIACCPSKTQVEIWKAEDGSVISSHSFDEKLDYSPLAWSPNGQMLAVRAQKHVYTLVPGVSTPLLAYASQAIGTSGYQRLIWSPDSQRLATQADNTFFGSGGSDPLFTIWDARTGQHKITYANTDQNSSPMANLAWSPDGKYIAVQRTDQVVEIWKVA